MEVLGITMILGLSTAALLGAFALYVLSVIGMWKIFEKTGKPAWHALIPFLNTYDMYDICWDRRYGIAAIIAELTTNAINQKGEDAGSFLKALAGLVGIALLVLNAMFCSKLAKSFGKGGGFAVGLFFLQPIFLILLGFGDASYLGPQD